MTGTPQAWARAYRPLRPQSLAVQLVVLVLAEIGLYASYADHDARFHWVTHFLVALAFTALLLLARLLLTGAPGPRFLLLTVLGFHLYAMAPDLLFRGGVPHYRWMDVFLGHVAAHYLPGGDASWLVIALACTGGYVAALTLWLRARTAEAAAGLPPGVGVTGMAVLRPQADPRTTPLACQRYGDGQTAVLLLHGLGASAAFWRPVAARLAERGASVLVPDLLGFGGSIGIGTHFHLDDQAAAVIRLLDSPPSQVGPAVLAAHSYGAAVAVRLAAERPDLVRRLVLITPAAFADAEQARRRIAGRSWIAGKTLSGSPVADLACGAMCLLRRPLTALAPRVASRATPDLPPQVARDAVTYVWPAYRDALASLLTDTTLRRWLAHPALPTRVVLAEQDATVPAGELTALLGTDVEVVSLPGTHTLPLEHPDQVAAAIDGAERNVSGSRPL